MVTVGRLDGKLGAIVRAGLRVVTDALEHAAGGERLRTVPSWMGVPDRLLAPVFDMSGYNSRARA